MKVLVITLTCLIAVALSAGEEAAAFKCYDHTYDATAKAWKASAKVADCAADTKKCNQPDKEAKDTYVVPLKGCGPCLAAALTAKTCKECDKDSCNSASTLAFVMLPLLAVVFHLW